MSKHTMMKLQRVPHKEHRIQFFDRVGQQSYDFLRLVSHINVRHRLLRLGTYQKIIKQEQNYKNILIWLSIITSLQFKKMNKFQSAKFQDLKIIETLAQTHGGNTKIYLVRYQNELQVCKSISKASVINDAKGIEHVKNQKQALKHFTQLKCGNICSLNGTFQDQNNLYIMMQMVEGLPLHKLLQMMGPFNQRVVRILSVQIAQIMRQFHEQGYIYRDIKSSNFMVNIKGKVKMIDLGKCKRIQKQRTYTICGTTHAMPPDIYKKQGYSYQFDYYSFGVLVYELLVGNSPFGYGSSNKQILDDIQNGLTAEALEKINNKKAQDIITKLIVKQPAKRLGCEGGFSQILKHPFFEQDLLYAMDILNNEDELSQYQEQFSQFVSEIQDLGIDKQKYNEITKDDPFYNFLE